MYWVIFDFAAHFVDSNFCFASAGVFDFLIKSITASILFTAIERPIRIFAFSLALFNL